MRDNKSVFIPVVGFALGLFLIALLTVSLFRDLSGAPNSLSFASFLEYLSNVPDIKFVKISDFAITGSWGAFNFLKNFLNLFAKFAGFAVWFGQNIYNLLIWLWYFVSYLFVV